MPGSSFRYAHNCLGWACFKGPRPYRTSADPEFEFVDTLEEVSETLTQSGYVRCTEEEATCIVTGEGPYDIGHVLIRWQGREDVTDADWLEAWGDVEWWASKMGPAGVTILHERGALTGDVNYENELAYFKPE